jgi:type VI protein secretion system component VasK
MTAAILAILAALVPFLIWLWKRRDAREDNPQTQHDQKREQIAREIARSDEAGANRSLDDDLERLRNLQSNQRRPPGPPPPGK